MLNQVLKSGLFIALIGISTNQAKAISPTFSIDEYIETLNMNFCQRHVLHDTMACKPQFWSREFRSTVVGMDNRFDIWLRETDGLVGISLRGTTRQPISWMENFYSAMIPAKGTLQIDDSTEFKYIFAERKDAAVHIGWTYALGALHKQLLEQIRKYHALNHREFLIFGHSQGGALSYLTFAYVHYLQQSGELPSDMRFKMVASAAPKVGNIHFAYDFEAYTPAAWAYNVVNPEDWIPLMPFAVQTTDDMTATHPFVFIKKGLKTQKLIPRIAISSAYKGMDRKTRKARKSLQKNLGKRVGKQIKKNRPQFVQPSLHHSMNYSRTGTHIVLETNEDYYKIFPQVSDDIFIHHMSEPYLFLANVYKAKSKNAKEQSP